MCSADAVAADTADSTPISSLDLIKFSFLRRSATSQVGLHHYSLLKMLAARTHIYYFSKKGLLQVSQFMLVVHFFRLFLHLLIYGILIVNIIIIMDILEWPKH